jgi:hypothetical protein
LQIAGGSPSAGLAPVTSASTVARWCPQKEELDSPLPGTGLRMEPPPHPATVDDLVDALVADDPAR